MAERLRQYRIGKELYPRYKYATEEIKRAYTKYSRLTSECGLSGEPHLPIFGDVLVNILESHVDVLIEADELSPKSMPDPTNFETMNHEQAKTQFSDLSENERLPTIYVTKYTEKNVPQDYFGNMIVYISGGPISDSKWSRYEDTYICVSNKKSCREDISEMLARYVFSYMRNRTELLHCIAHCAEADDYTQKLGRCLENRNNCSPSTPVKVMGSVTFRRCKSSTTEANLLVEKSLDAGVGLEEHLKRARTMRPRLLDAVSEICTMYKRSEIPENERPQIKRREKNVNEEVANELTMKIPQILGVGYRLDTLVVTLDASVMNDEKTMDKIKSDTRKVFDTRNIKEESINFIFSTRDMNRFTSDVRTGGFIRAVGKGTLGGFVWKGNPPHKECCLISANHVLQDKEKSDVYLISSNSTERMIAKTLPPRMDVEYLKPLDIAAAKLRIQPTEEPSLLDSTGQRANSRVYDYQNQDQVELLNGLKVHLWGAKTRLGKGKITMPLYYRSATSNIQTLIGLEDLDSDEASDAEESSRVLATEGDSGSLVCSNTPRGIYIDAIGMLIGKQHESDAQTPSLMTSASVTKNVDTSGNGINKVTELYARVTLAGNNASKGDAATQNQSVVSASSYGSSRNLYLAFDLQAGLRHMNDKYRDDFQLCKSVNNP
ncbi:uncharacterized protein LOC127858958 [Dreissena polymorpha]|uniref:Uncharacterized protein n=1 Tax=Dreissena polymorpha TaxID=45954 RepID=A0A9D3Z6S4_DREPO|nr:uncharacterized protein LOC127858958 [Dreissena polymorpha]KAH3711387.1 hypothetical protein DPMN_071056 [Dreissena polymorpha]